MRITHSGVYIDRQGRRLKHMSFAQRAELRKKYVANIPRWRHPLVGYLLSIPLVAAAMFMTLYVWDMLGGFHFPGALLVIAVLIVAIFWGVGPSLFAVLLSTLLLMYYYVPPYQQAALKDWHDALQLLPFIVSGITIAIITAQRERARLNALVAEQDLDMYAQELEQINQKLHDANQAKDRFISIASHELKTPITTIRGQAQLALRRLSRQKDLPSDMENIRVSLERIDDQTKRLTSLIEELMDVSSMRAGKVALRKRACDLRDICREVVEDQRLLTERPIVLDASAEPVKMRVDGDRLEQVLVNLVSNAVKYSPEGSPVEVCVGLCENSALIQVKDHGKGIAAGHLPHIFETFYRTPEAEASSKQGLGLGLAISKEIVERHGGSIWCESEPGKGSTFFVKLPLH